VHQPRPDPALDPTRARFRLTFHGQREALSFLTGELDENHRAEVFAASWRLAQDASWTLRIERVTNT
jgi:hypothetical protein